MLASHSFVIVGYGREPIERLTNGQAFAGGIAVQFFFAISGFLIAYSWFRTENPARYLWKRGLRIYPAFVVACLFCVLVVAPIGASDVPRYLRELPSLHLFLGIASLAKLSVAGTFAQLDGSLWTIKIEFECYILLAALGLIGVLRNRWLVLSAFLLTAVFASLAEWGKGPFTSGTYQDHLRFASFFLGGTALYLWWEFVPMSRALAAGALVALVGATYLGELKDVMPFLGIYLLFFIAFTPALPLQNFARRGDFSYGIYLFAWPIQLLVFRWLPGSPNAYVVTAVAAPLVLTAAWLSWHLVEKPSLQLKSVRFAPFERVGWTPRGQSVATEAAIASPTDGSV